MPQIEDAGLAAELTGLVSARAFADLAGPFLTERGLRMSVNFPLDVLLQPAALDRLEEQRIAAGLAADHIVIELTESRPVDDIPMLRRSLERLRGLGYGAAIDDVGPAVPRLAPLLELPFTSLKLDKDLVQQVDDSAEICDVPRHDDRPGQGARSDRGGRGCGNRRDLGPDVRPGRG